MSQLQTINFPIIFKEVPGQLVANQIAKFSRNDGVEVRIFVTLVTSHPDKPGTLLFMGSDTVGSTTVIGYIDTANGNVGSYRPAH